MCEERNQNEVISKLLTLIEEKDKSILVKIKG